MHEIRLRDVAPTTIKELQLLGKEFHLSTTTAIIHKLITKHKGDMQHTAELSKRNSELHKRLAVFVDREKMQQETIMKFLRNLDFYKNEAKSNLKEFTKSKGQTKRYKPLPSSLFQKSQKQ